MKSTILSLLVAVMVPAVSSAKVEDFNAMINENAKAQTELHNDLKNQVGETRQAQMKAHKETFVAAADSKSINAPTSKSMLTFRKEMVDYRASDAKQMNRVANEIKAMDAY